MQAWRRRLSVAFSVGWLLSEAFPASAQKTAPDKDQEVISAIRKDIEAAYAPLGGCAEVGQGLCRPAVG